jgi:hypothetical protein
MSVMSRSFLRCSAWALVVAIVIVLAVTTGSAVAHDLQHSAHHAAGMHSTGICAWMCAAAGAVGTPVVQVSSITLVGSCPPVSASHPFEAGASAPLHPRAPPSLHA